MFSFAKKLVDRFEGTNQDQGVSDSYFKNTLRINNRGYALRVLSVEPHSIANEVGLESWFDYIVKINNHELPMVYPSLSNYSYSINEDGTINYGGDTTQEQASLVDFNLLNQEISNVANNEHSSKDLILDVWSAKGGIIRQIVIPLKPSSGETTKNSSLRSLIPEKFADLGVTLQSQHINTATYVWRILNTHANSPAFQAQLVPYSDYIIGCDSAFADDPYGKGLLSQGGESLLSKTVLRYYNHNFEKTHDDCVPITLYVYNHDYDVLRPVTVNLTRLWGTGHNQGILGCDVGYGLLHRVPEVVGKFDSDKIIDDLLFENHEDVNYQLQNLESAAQPSISPPPPSGNQFTPMAVQIPPPPPKAGGARKKKASARPNALNELNDYMNEELEKSKEPVDTKSSGDATAPPPPPPTSKQ